MFTEIDNLTNKLHQMEMTWWLNHTLFTFNWWFILLVNLFFFIAFLIFMDRGSVLRITLALLFCFVIVGTVDQIGQFISLWSYPHEFFVFTENFNAVDFLAVPSIFALMYQMFTTWRMFLVANLFICLINAYIAEPIFVALGIYKLDHWSYFGSLVTLFFIAIVVKALTDLVANSRDNYTKDYSPTQKVWNRKQKAR